MALDKDFEARVAALKTLAQSERLHAGDLKSFYEEAMRVVPVHEGTDAIVLVGSNGNQAANTRRPFGENLSQFGDPDFIRKVIESRRPAVSNLFTTRVVQRPVISMGVPVVVDGVIKYALTMSLSPAFIQRLLEQQAIPSHWLSTIIDANKIIVARTRDMDKLLGKTASPSLTAKSAENAEGWWIGQPFGGEKSYVAHRRSNFSGWTVAIAVPVSAVNRPLWQALGFMIGGIVFFTLVALGIALLFWRRILSSITALLEAAKTRGGGPTPEIEASPIVELDQVRKEIETAAGERKKAADRLQYEALLVQKITESVAESIFITDSDGHVTFVNPKALDTFGFSAKELLGHSLHEKIHDRHPDGTPFPRGECVFAHTRTTGRVITNHEDVFFRKNGTAVIVECSHAPLEADGRPIGTLLIARDITDSRRQSNGGSFQGTQE
ncbi:MAG: PAS domain S-box protein [Deltaproteobacteria bacterium]|nr:PAS domain S-box protein [Deltaproteobacteria bacterium]